MQQQELFPLAPVAEKQIFRNYEINDKKRMPLFLSLLGISLIFHSVILASAVLVPGIRDTFYLVALFGEARNSKMVSKAYDKEDIIGDSYTVTYVDTSNNFKYPEGYFSTIDPNDPVAMAKFDEKYTDTTSTGDLGTFNPTNPTVVPDTPNNSYNPTSPSTSQFKSIPPPRARNYSPKPSRRNKGGVLPPLPPGKSPYEKNDENNVKLPPEMQAQVDKLREEKEKQNKEKENKTKPEEKPKSDDASAGLTPEKGEFNKKPFEDLGQEVKKLIAENKLDLNQSASVTLEGYLDKEGNLVQRPDKQGNQKKLFVANSAGDEKLVETISRAIAALDKSGFLYYLRDLSKDGKKNTKIVFQVEKNQQDLKVQIKSDIDGKTSPESIASNLNVAIQAGKLLRKGKVEGNILEKASVKSEGKTVIINWEMPSADALQMLQKQLADLPPPQQSASDATEKNAKKEVAK